MQPLLRETSCLFVDKLSFSFASEVVGEIDFVRGFGGFTQIFVLVNEMMKSRKAAKHAKIHSSTLRLSAFA
ncbi:MAG: hypothetical protein R3A44_39795 [Caldilineaceae bacterium]